MITQELIDYIRHQLAAGKSRDEITNVLIGQGWHQHDVDQGFASADSGAIAAVRSELPPLKVLFSDSFELMKARILTMVLSGLVPILCVIGAAIVTAILVFLLYRTNQEAGMIAGVTLGVAFIVAYFYAIFWSATAFIVALRDAAEKTGVKENLKRSRPLIGSFLLVSIITNLAVMGGMVLLIIPGIILMVWYGFSGMIMVAENKKGRLALAQSKAYVYGRGWKVFGRIVLLQVLFLVPYIALQIVANFSANDSAGIGINIVLTILQFLFTYYTLAYHYTLYKQLKDTSGPTDAQKHIGAVTGWTIWGAIGGVLIFATFVSLMIIFGLSLVRSAERDATRLSDIQAIGKALDSYYYDNEAYPTNLNQLAPNYVPTLPIAPTPADGNCTEGENKYTYGPSEDLQNFYLDFCLGEETSGYEGGMHTLSADGIDEEDYLPILNEEY